MTTTAIQGGRYVSGSCDMTSPFPSSDGEYTYFVRITPGSKRYKAVFGGTNEIRKCGSTCLSVSYVSGDFDISPYLHPGMFTVLRHSSFQGKWEWLNDYPSLTSPSLPLSPPLLSLSPFLTFCACVRVYVCYVLSLCSAHSCVDSYSMILYCSACIIAFCIVRDAFDCIRNAYFGQ